MPLVDLPENTIRKSRIIWLASYPRSGNTLLRTVLWHCFGLRSASIHPNDLYGNKVIENYVGHIEHDPDGKIRFPPNTLPLVKTHEPPPDMNPAIYVVRDGRAASVSLWRFYGEQYPLEAIIEGQHHFGTWSGHVASWKPWERPNTLLIRYEEMTGNLPHVIEQISTFLGSAIVMDRIPDRETLADIGGQWIKKPSDWRSVFSASLLKRFLEINGEMLRRMNYVS